LKKDKMIFSISMKNQIQKIVKLAGKCCKGLVNGTRNMLLLKTGRILNPEHLWIEVTSKCNCRCSFCHIGQNKQVENPLSPDEIENVLRDNIFKNLESVVLSGGEPFLRDDFEEIILRVHKVLPKSKILFGTNCSLPEKVLEVVTSVIERLGIPIGVGISVDGIGERHDLVRGTPGLFKKVDWLLHGLTALKRKVGDKLDITIGFVLSDDTLPILDDVKRYAANLGIHLHVQWYNESTYYNNVGQHRLKNVGDIISAVRLLPATSIHRMGIRMLEGKAIKFTCFSLQSFCLLKCNGDIVPCFNFWDTTIGNIRELSPSRIWQNPEARKARRKVYNCKGCLNACGVNWSLGAGFYPKLLFYLKHPKEAFKHIF